MDKNKKLCELLGIEYKKGKATLHNCGIQPYYSTPPDEPDFLSDSGRIELLRIMEKRKDYINFIRDTGLYAFTGMNYLTEPQGGTKLVDTVIEFLEIQKARKE